MNRQYDSHDKTGRGMLWLASISLVLALTWMFSNITETRQLSQVAWLGGDRLVLKQNRAGQYVTEGSINGRKVIFLLDTGATDVAISRDFARSLGINRGPRVTAVTANGTVQGYMARLDSVALGPLEQRNVRAMVIPDLGDQFLLGMSFLQELTLTQTGDEMVIQPNSASATD